MKPCRHCNIRPAVVQYGDRYQVECLSGKCPVCPATGPRDTINEAEKEWEQDHGTV